MIQLWVVLLEIPHRATHVYVMTLVKLSIVFDFVLVLVCMYHYYARYIVPAWVALILYLVVLILLIKVLTGYFIGKYLLYIPSLFAPDNNNVVHFPGCILSNRYSLQYQSKSKITLPRSWNYKRKPCWFTLQTILQRNGPKSYKRRARIYLQHSYFRGNADKILAFFDHLLTNPLTLVKEFLYCLKGKICIFLTFPLVVCSTYPMSLYCEKWP